MVDTNAVVCVESFDGRPCFDVARLIEFRAGGGWAGKYDVVHVCTKIRMLLDSGCFVPIGKEAPDDALHDMRSVIRSSSSGIHASFP